jgi:hypothetical protein
MMGSAYETTTEDEGDVQELFRGALKAGHEVQDDGENDGDAKGDRDIDEGMGQHLNERVVQSSLFVPGDDVSLGVERGNFGHGIQSREEEGAGRGREPRRAKKARQILTRKEHHLARSRLKWLQASSRRRFP